MNREALVVRPGQSTPRARVLSDEELVRIWRCTTFPQTNLPAHFATIVKLLILTGQRRTEIASLKCEYLSHNQPTLCLPNTLTKNGREQTIPIGPSTGAIIFPLLASSELLHFLFPARGKKDKAFNDWSKSKKALDKLSGVTGWTLHDLRRTFRTNLGKLGVMPHIAERLVNHISARSDMELVYDQHRYMPEMRDAIEKWETYLAELLARSLPTVETLLGSSKHAAARGHSLMLSSDVFRVFGDSDAFC